MESLNAILQKVIAAISAVAEHSIIRAYAAGRPNDNDRKQLCTFGVKVLEKASQKSDRIISVSGNKPYKKAGAAMVPKANSSCNSCALCAKSCPSGAINPARPRVSDKKKCIGCMRCISVCPKSARSINPIMTKVAAFAIKKACSEPKKNELII